MLYKDLFGGEDNLIARENIQKPTDKMQRPNESINRPSDDIMRPGENMRRSNENMMRPGDNMQCPSDNMQRPSDNMPWHNERTQQPRREMQCPSDNNRCPNDNAMWPREDATKKELLNKIRETIFAIVDLNQFLDTHPNCKEALELFTSLAFTLESLKREYTSKYGPLKATDSLNTTPFEWVSDMHMWPWQRNKEE